MNINELIDLVKSTRPIIMNSELVNAVTVKGAADFVTKVDFAVQEYLRTELFKTDPDIILLAEEQENKNLDPALSYWILDPIDGTTNLIHGYNMSCVSLGLYENGQMTMGVVYNPFTDETFSAERGKGAFLNGNPIHVSHRNEFKNCIISFGSSPYEKNLAKELFPIFRNVFEHTADFRRSASAALDLCYVAAGRVDGFIEYNLKPWDYSAGAMILSEAGGITTKWNGEKTPFLYNSSILSCTPEIYENLKAFLPDSISGSL